MAWIATKRKHVGVGWRDQAGREHWRACPDRTTARELKRQVEAEAALGRDWTPRRPGDATGLDEVLAQYLTVKAEELAPRTLVRYGQALDLALRFAEERHGAGVGISVLSRGFLEDLRSWLAAAENGRNGRARSRATVVKVLEPLELAWVWADESDRWEDVPRPRRLGLKRPRPARPVAPRFSEYDSMLVGLEKSTLESPWTRGEVTSPPWPVRLGLLQRFLGLRRTEGLLLEWRFFDLNEGVVDIPDEITKGGASGRCVPLHPQLLAFLKTWAPKEGFVVGASALELTGRGHVCRSFRRAWAGVGVREQAWRGQPTHAARKMVRTAMVNAGVQSDVIDAYLGHAGAGTGGRRYTDTLELMGSLRTALGAIPDFPVVEVRP
ncbi:MAG: site-specific integrase [Pseudomonadota bacterium]